MRPHQNLEAWKLSFQFVKDVYTTTAVFPIEEKYGIISQIRRAAVSVPTNIAEGAARQSKKEFRRFLYISLGSVSELETLLLLAQSLNFISSEKLSVLLLQLENVSKTISGLIKKLNTQL